jgi:predicted nucleotidyltransferase
MQSSDLNNPSDDATARWPNIAAAESLSRDKLAELSAIIGDLLPTDEGSLVVFGSLARREFTAGSDLDWAVVIDSRADSLHLKLVHELRKRLDDAKFKVPGPTEVFGGLIFSHELIHAIGGDEDTNKNMTRRLLLLLESTPIDTPGSKQVHDRIIRGILKRYVDEDASFTPANKRGDKIPRFLLNDVVRFWRTMAVDYANKYRARAGDKWALRNIKLRMSRKLLFVSGLFMCVSWALKNKEASTEPFSSQELLDHLLEWTRRPPLESMASIIETYGSPLAADIIGSYDQFLHLLGREEDRKVLEKLSPDDAYENQVFLRARDVANRFDEALRKLMFESSEDITPLIKKYGVF